MSYRREFIDDVSLYHPPVWEISVVQEKTSHLILWFIFWSLVAFGFFFFFKPAQVQQLGLNGLPNGQLDWKSLILASVLVGLFLTLMFWLLSSCL